MLCAKIRVGVTQGRIRHQLATESQRCVSRRRLKSITQLHLHRLRPFLVLKGAHLFSALKATGRVVSAARRMYGRRLARLSCKCARYVPWIWDFHFRTLFTNFFSSGPGSTFRILISVGTRWRFDRSHSVNKTIIRKQTKPSPKSSSASFFLNFCLS